MRGHYPGAATDLRWARIAWRLECSPALVAGVFFALVEHANERGTVSTWPLEEYATWADEDVATISAIIAELRAGEHITGDQLRVLADRKFDPTAAIRARRYRERKRAAKKKNAPRRVTQNRDNVTPSRDNVTPNRYASARVTQNRDNVTPSRDNVTPSRYGEGGDIGGGGVALSSSLLFNIKASTSNDAHALAQAEDFFQELKSAGAVRTQTAALDASRQAITWANRGVTLDQLRVAIQLARQARQAAGSTQPLNVGYVASKLTAVRETGDPTPISSAPAKVTKPRHTPAEVELVSLIAWAEQQVEFGKLERAEADEHISRARSRLGLPAPSSEVSA